MARFNYYRSLFNDLARAKDLAQFIRDNTQAERLPDGSLPVDVLKRIGQDCIRPVRDALRRYYAERPDRFAKSMQETPHYLYEDVLEAYVTEFGFLPAWTNDATDEEIDEYVEDMRMEVRSPYDCSGQRFTHYLFWHRVPAGVVYVHSTGLDL